MESIHQDLEIRSTRTGDLSDLYQIFAKVNSTAGQFPWFADTSEEFFRSLWTQPENTSYVAIVEGKVAGGYFIKPQWPGRGSHIATGVYMVSPDFRRKRIGHRLGEHSQNVAKKMGYLAMQYNLVVSKNEEGLSLWKKLGFQIIGTLPNAYQHGRYGLVDAYVMHRYL